MQIKKLILFILTISVCLTVTSCYDSTEVDDMIYILAIGIDEIGENNVSYTFQAAVPLNISSGVETGFADSEESATIQNINITSNNIFSAFGQINAKYAKELNVAHCKLILFSENTSTNTFKQNIVNINSYDEFRPDILVTMCRNYAGDYLKDISSPFEKNPARYFEMFFKSNFSTQMFSTEINEFEKASIVSIPFLQKNNVVQSAIIKNYENILILSPEETLTLNIITGKFKKGFITIPQTGYTTSVHKIKTPEIKVAISNHNPIFRIKIKLYTNSVKNNATKIDIEKHITNLCLNLLNKSSKELNEDIIGLINFSKINFITTSAYNNYNWQEKFKQAEFKVTVICKTNK